MSITNAQCQAYGNEIRTKVEEFYGPRISELEEMISEEIAAGRDPTAKEIQGGIVIVNLVKLLEEVKKMKLEAMNSATTHEENCDKEAIPDWVGDAQKVADFATAIAALPFILLTGNLAAVHVDLGEVYRGRPLGGDNALIPKIKTDVLDFFNIEGDVRKLLEDPIYETTNFVRDGLFRLREELDNFIRKPFG